MVLVYIITTSRQLNTMHNQLEEMQYSRGVQIQPLPYFEKPKADLDLPRFYVGPQTDFKKMELMCMLHVGFSVSNVGNGPAIAIDFLPMICSGSRVKEQIILLKETLCSRIDCVPSGDRDPKPAEFHFSDKEHKAVEDLARNGRLAFGCEMVFKNSLGTAFREQVAFWLTIASEKDLETLTSSLKRIKTAEIDFSKQVKRYKELMNVGRTEEAKKVLDDANALLEKDLGKQIVLKVETSWGAFDVRPISSSDYQKLLDDKLESERATRDAIRGCSKKNE
jgi:hypothetical protein